MRSEPGLPLWPLAALAAVLPLVAALLAWALSTRLGLIEACVPLVEGCVSISRAAREGLPNLLFRALMLPAATLQALVWLLLWLDLRRRHPAPHTIRGLRALPWLGLAAGVALVLYGSFLGTEGAVYRWLRQYGTVAYFGCTCLCMLIAGGAVQRLAAAGLLSLPVVLERALVGLAVTLVALGIVNAIVAAAIGGAMKGRVENVTEWWGALIFVLGFLAIAALWHRQRRMLSLDETAPAPSPGRQPLR